MKGPGAGSKRKAAGSEASGTRTSACFDLFEFYLHGLISGSKTVLPNKIAQGGGCVVAEGRLRHAVQGAACPQQRAECVNVVVIYKENTPAFVDDPCQSESRRKAADEIRQKLGLEAGGLVCGRCGSCHLLACGATAEGVRFVIDSLQLDCPQTRLLAQLDCPQTRLLAPLQCGANVTATPAARVAAAGSSPRGEEGDTIVICDSDSEDQGVESAGQSAAQHQGNVSSTSCGEPVPDRLQADGAGTVILRHVQCPENERFVSHLDLLSFLIQVNACKSTSKPDKDQAKTKAWAFKQAANVLRRLPGHLQSACA
jgi:hypothetical protein